MILQTFDQKQKIGQRLAKIHTEKTRKKRSWPRADFLFNLKYFIYLI